MMVEEEDSVWSPNRALTATQTSKARKELYERPEERDRKLEALREVLDKVPGLIPKTDDEFLLRFLRARKFSVDNSLKLMVSYYRQRKNNPHLYRRLQTTCISELLEVNLVGMLPHRDREGRAIFVFNSAHIWEPSRIPLEDIILYCMLTLERAIQAQDVQVNGVVCLVDCRGFSLRHVCASSPHKLAQFFAVTQGSFPVRVKQIHILNQPRIFSVVFAIIKKLLSQKLHERFFFHGRKTSSLLEYFDPEILPQEFGGKIGPFDNTHWNKYLVENDQVVLREKDYGFVSV